MTDQLADNFSDEDVKNAFKVAHIVYGGMDPASPQWQTCLDVAKSIDIDGMTMASLVRWKHNANPHQSFSDCRAFNQKYPLGTDGVMMNGYGQKVIVRIDNPAMVFADPMGGEKVRAFFYPLGWRDVVDFSIQEKKITIAEELTLMGQQAKQIFKMEIARELFHAAIHADPECVHPYNELGVLEASLYNHKEADVYFTKALEIQPRSGEILNNRAMSLRVLGRPLEAIADCQEALRLIPGNDTIALNCASALDDVGRTEEALKIVDEYIYRQPEKVNARYNRAITLLSCGRLQEGWKDFVWRLAQPMQNAHYEHFLAPRWTNESFSGKKVLVWCEQGIGDEVMIASMIPDLVSAGADVTFLCSDRLVPLFKRSFPTVTVDLRPAVSSMDVFSRTPLRAELLPASVRNHEFDFQMSQADLGAAFRPTIYSFPKTMGYLKLDLSALDLRYRIRSQHPDTTIVGLSWNSKKNTTIGKLKSLELKDLAPILKTPGMTFVNLQYGDCAAEIAAVEAELGIKILSFPEINPLENIDTFAALVGAMDVVVSVSNTTVHVAGALNIKTMVLVPEGAGRLWYWFRKRLDSPWYPSARLYRQPNTSNWETPINQIACDLAQWPAVML